MNAMLIIKVLLVLNILSMGLLAVFYLRRRRLSFMAYSMWGLLAIALPVLGPFLVIALRPGTPRGRLRS